MAVPTLTSANGQDDLFTDWSNTTLVAQVDDNIWEYYISVSDHKNEHGGYTFNGRHTAKTRGTKITADSKVAIGASEITLINGEQYEIKANQQSLIYKSNNSGIVQLNMNVVSAIRGDANGDGQVTIAEAVMFQKWLLGESKELIC